KIAVLDRPYSVYYRVRVLDRFKIPLKPLENSNELESFVKGWLRFQAYVNDVANELHKLWTMKRELFFVVPENDTPADPAVRMSIDSLSTPGTPKTTEYFGFFGIKKP